VSQPLHGQCSTIQQTSECYVKMFGLFLMILGGGTIAYLYWLLIRSRPADQRAIDIFTMQRGLRVISVTRSYNYFRYLIRGIANGLSSTTRFYDIAVEDSEGSRGDIHIAFDPLFGSGQLTVLKSEGLLVAPRDELARLTQSDLETLTWYERLVLFGTGAGISGFIFSGVLQQYLSPPKRPVFPEAALGYTHLLQAKYGSVYGTYFEFLTVTYGVWTMWGLCAVSGLFGYMLGIRQKSRTYPLQICAAAAISMVLYCAIWWLFSPSGRAGFASAPTGSR